MMGHPTDWSTYYVRSMAFLPECRERGWADQFVKGICEPLRKAGCLRWECECSPANLAVMRLLTSNGHLQTGMLTSERWGQVLRFTKYLRDDAEQAFRRQFIYVPAFGRDAKPK
jgi:hypothetical protein